MDPDFIRDLFSEFGPVEVRRMFSGAGVYADGIIFALVLRDVLYLTADEQSAPRFEAEGCGRFDYTRKGGRRGHLPYWRIPDRLYDDPTELADWARQALAVARARKAAQVKRKPRSTRKKRR
jgi:DNA transformation protein